MIFLGDIAIPDNKIADLLGKPKCFGEETIIANLEGPLVDSSQKKWLSQNIVFNTDASIEYMKKMNIKVISLSNNHILDVKKNLNKTLKILNENSVYYCGVGENLEMAQEPARIVIDGVKYCFLSFGWDVIGCQYATNIRRE